MTAVQMLPDLRRSQAYTNEEAMIIQVKTSSANHFGVRLL
jgi:hypothetical protein